MVKAVTTRHIALDIAGEFGIMGAGSNDGAIYEETVQSLGG